MVIIIIINNICIIIIIVIIIYSFICVLFMMQLTEAAHGQTNLKLNALDLVYHVMFDG